MIYTVKSHPTKYSGTVFRSRLEARWAAFFDLAGWSWEYEPLDLDGWTPDFRVAFPCGHSACNGEHILLAEVKPYYEIDDFKNHHCMMFPFGQDEEGQMIPADASAAFGVNPNVSLWDMQHGDGGGTYCVTALISEADLLWKQAGNITRYRPVIVTA